MNSFPITITVEKPIFGLSTEEKRYIALIFSKLLKISYSTIEKIFPEVKKSFISKTIKKLDNFDTTEDLRKYNKGISKINETSEQKIVELIQTNPQKSIRKMEQEVQNLKKTTIHKIVKNLGYTKIRPVLRPTLKENHKEQRMQYCKYHINKQSQFTNTLFTDEVLFELNDNRRLVWYRPNLEEKPLKYTKNPNLKTLVWGGISYHGKTDLYFYRLDKKEKCNAESYIACLETAWNKIEKLFGKKYYFMHDNARPHTSKITQEFLESKSANVITHPPYSPDLNPIEKVWAFLKNMVSYTEYNNIDELVSAIESSWNFIKVEHLRSFIRHHQEKLPKILEMQGEYID